MDKRDRTHQAFDPSSLPVPNRSDQVPQRVKADPDDHIDLFSHRERFKDGRPYCKEAWAQYGLTMVTFFFSTVGLENADNDELLELLEREGLVEFLDGERRGEAMTWTDASRNEMWSVNIVIGDEDELYARA